MTTPHRGLPPPAAMTLPAPAQGSNSGLGPLPPQWQASEESLRAWLQTKAEEERRKAEEERTRQEQYRGDTRRVELEMLRESFKYGIPPPLVPLVLMGKGAGGEWVHELVAQQMGISPQHSGQLAIQGSAHPASPAGPALRRETRSIHQMHQQSASSQGAGQPTPPPLPPHHQQQQPMGPPGAAAGGAPPPPHYSTYQLPTAGRTGPSQSQPPIQATTPQGAPPRSNLPRINTGPGESKYIQQIHPVPMGPPPGAPGIPAPQTSHHQQESVASQISFHHWVPPTSQTGGGGTSSSSAQAATASPQRQLDSPFTHHPAPNALSGSDYLNVSSPKKRKMTTQPLHPPPPSTQPFSPQAQSLSSPAGATPRTRRGHTRNRSDTHPLPPSRGYESYSRPTTRQRKLAGAEEVSSIGEAISHIGQQSSPSFQPSAGDSGGSGSGTPSHTTPKESQHQRQQSAPPPQHSQTPSRPYPAGSDYRRQPYQSSPPPPPPPEAGSDREREGGDGSRS